MRYRILDIETIGHPDADLWFDPCEPDPDLLKPFLPDSRLKDPIKVAANLADIAAKEAARPALIEASIAERNAERAKKFGLDADTCRIVALGYYDVGATEPTVYLMRNEFEEREHLKMFWESYRQQYTRIVSFYGSRFDLPVMVMRSIDLDVPMPADFVFYPAWKSGHIDLYEKLSCNGARRDVKALKFYARKYGFGTLDKVDGSQIAQLVTEERWQEVHDHCLSDIGLTHALANRLGELKMTAVAA